ncbi:protein of unknown function DUF1572 [Allomuricauda ruestringensis DSM 13258]|uniref:DUF1572 domain-containing protein n=1 Tax=Allomuricauda ruestringensis (strain DSM 13258 / CIP 107369 / LMG 19739 / B1) TaxID=886377 RepID=G2PP46_ALLRU|nr:DUF1572 family protein [Allomuricauda ruestringensis]AEM71431.1 protein of unknown function DUF1572 [Allomuricauda ruestringensis DSM 13258]
MDFQENYIASVKFEFQRYKTMGDKTFVQISDADIHWKHNDSDNSIAIIVKHIVGNMMSRWTNFLSEDGEKSWRNRDMEFEEPYTSKSEMITAWEKGWKCLFEALGSINPSNFQSKVKIRNEEHSIVEAINRQLAHYASHVGQIVFVGKMIKGHDWKSLSIPKGASKDFNKKMFGTGKP